MLTSWPARRFGFSLVVVLLGLTGSIVSSPLQADEEDPVDATVYEAPTAKSGTGAFIKQAAYRSDTLGGDFLGQRMYVVIQGQTYLFWGVRAVSLDQDSPLRKLSLRVRGRAPENFEVGDVLSRLDGVTLDRNKFKDSDGVWNMPQLEEHYGKTDVRWIRQGTHAVNIGQIQLDNLGTGGTGVAPVTP